MAETWLITGANRGMGLEHVRQALAAGESVVATARNPDDSAALHALALAHGLRLRIEGFDATDHAAPETLAERLAGVPVDILVNNAGMTRAGWPGVASQPEPADRDPAAWEEVLRVNLVAPFALTMALRANIAASTRRLVVMMSSDLGSISSNSMGGAYAYRASKAGLNMVTKGLSIDLQADGISVIAMAPGWVRTDLGTAAATWSVKDSVAKQREVIARVTPADNGRFVNLLGEAVAW